MTSRRRAFLYLFVGLYFCLLTALQPYLSIGKVILIIPGGIFLTLAFNEYLKNKP